jgi:hypothetical protein
MKLYMLDLGVAFLLVEVSKIKNFWGHKLIPQPSVEMRLKTTHKLMLSLLEAPSIIDG